MPVNVVSAVVVGRLLEDRYRLERRDAFLYALVPQLAGIPDAPALAVSIALGRRNEPPPPPPADASTGVVEGPADGSTGLWPPGEEGETVTVPPLAGKTRSDLEQMTRDDPRLRFKVEGPANGTVSEQQPGPGESHPAGRPIHVKLSPGK